MKERPILFSAPMVRAILEGRKTQTRRVIKPQPDSVVNRKIALHHVAPDSLVDWTKRIRCPHGKPGERLWVKETHRFENPAELIGVDDWRMDCRYDADGNTRYIYEADVPIETKHFQKLATGKLRPSIFMPRWASRITLEIESVRVERLQDISEENAKAEGVQSGWYDDHGETPGRYLYFTDADGSGTGHAKPSEAYRLLWESINGPGSWDENPFVWVITFRKL